MLIKATDNTMQQRAWLREYIENLGGNPGNGGGNNFCDVEGIAYLVYVELE